MTERPYLNQGDPRWAKVKAGRSRSATLQQVGCVITCMAQALRSLHIDPEATPVSVQQRALALWDGRADTAPFSGNTAAAFQNRLGAAVGLLVRDRVNAIEGARFFSDVFATFGMAGLLLMHVDSRDDGLDEPNHWVLGLRLEGTVDDGVVIYADPDGGHEGQMPLRTLRAPSPKGKPYQLRGIRRVLSASALG
jgi:hypothetical protein